MKEIKTKDIILGALAIVGGFVIYAEVVAYFRKEPRLDYNPHHAVNGIDTVYSDSIYTIQVKILKTEDYPLDKNKEDYK